jgi:hypothetical protein
MDNLEFKNLRKQLEIVGTDSIAFLIKYLVEKGKQDTGNLISGLSFKVIEDTNGLLLQIISKEKYFDVVDEGRKKGAKQPPIKPIQSWVQRKGIVISNYSSKQTAFIIARSISKKGIKGIDAKKKMIQNVIDNSETILKYGMVEDINVLLEKIIK